MGSRIGVQKRSAALIGIPFQDYLARLTAGDKWCTGCRDWHPATQFGPDRSRRDGRSSRCRISRIVATGRPGVHERRLRAAQGEAWCRTCRAWLPVEEVVQGACRPHLREEARVRCAKNHPRSSRRRQPEGQRLAPIPGWWRDERFREFGGLCAYGCGRNADALDHVYPVARGGTSRPDNLVPACKPCNSSKKDRDPGLWLERMFQAFPCDFIDLISLNCETAGHLEGTD